MTDVEFRAGVKEVHNTCIKYNFMEREAYPYGFGIKVADLIAQWNDYDSCESTSKSIMRDELRGFLPIMDKWVIKENEPLLSVRLSEGGLAGEKRELHLSEAFVFLHCDLAKPVFDIKEVELAKKYILDNVIPAFDNCRGNKNNFISQDYFYESLEDILVSYNVFNTKITNNMLSLLDIKYEELNRSSLCNLRNDILITPLEYASPYKLEKPDTYFGTSKKGVFGANVLLDKNTLDEMCEKLEVDLLTIIPISKDRLMFVKDEVRNYPTFTDSLRNIIWKEKNADFLSDGVFLYDKNSAEINYYSYDIDELCMWFVPDSDEYFIPNNSFLKSLNLTH